MFVSRSVIDTTLESERLEPKNGGSEDDVPFELDAF